MAVMCRRCDRVSKQLYRVTTKYRGAVLLDMLVCAACARLGRRLGLAMVKVESAKRKTGQAASSLKDQSNQQAIGNRH